MILVTIQFDCDAFIRDSKIRAIFFNNMLWVYMEVKECKFIENFSLERSKIFGEQPTPNNKDLEQASLI